MTLRRSNVTLASRVMLPADVAFFGIVAISFLTTPAERLRATPGLEYLDDGVGIRGVGFAFAAVAVLLATALLTHRRTLAKVTLAAAVVWMSVFAVAMLGAAVFDQASWSAWVWPAYIATACWASLLSLEAGEV